MVPKISIIIACYNSERFLYETLDSILNQTFTDFELICVNDGSTDKTLDILEDYAKKDSRIIIYSKPNGGMPAKTANYGMDRSQGKYVIGIGHDDYLSKDALERMYNRAIETGADAVLPEVYKFQDAPVDERKFNKFFAGLRRDYIFDNGKKIKKDDCDIILSGPEASMLSMDWTIHAWSLWNGDLIRSIRFEEFSMNSDEYSARVLYLKCKTVVFSSGIYYYRYSNDSISHKLNIKRFGLLETQFRLYDFCVNNKFDNSCIDLVCSSTFHALYTLYILMFHLSSLPNHLSKNERLELQKNLKLYWKKLDRIRLKKILSKRSFCYRFIVSLLISNFFIFRSGCWILFHLRRHR